MEFFWERRGGKRNIFDVIPNRIKFNIQINVHLKKYIYIQN